MSDETLLKLYKKARLDAITETGLEMPDHCTYTLNAVLNHPIDL